MKINKYIIGGLIFSFANLYYGIRSLKKFNDKYNKMDDDGKSMNYDIKINLYEMIIVGIVGIVVSIILAFN